MKKAAVFVLLILFSFQILFAQEALKSAEEEYYDSLSIQGLALRPTLGYRTLSDSVWVIDESCVHPWMHNDLGTLHTIYDVQEKKSNLFLDGINQSLKLRIYGPNWFNSYNFRYPYGKNDGALWQGVGYNTSLTAGLRLEGFGFEATLKPQITWSQNKDFNHLPGLYGFDGSYFSKEIDLVQRYGYEPLYTFSWGDSEIRYTWHTFTIGLGTQSPWVGPAFLNPMLGSNNADPYLKLDFGIRKTAVTLPFLDWYLGELEARVWLGKLTQSDYFTGTKRNDDRMVCMSSYSYSPSFVDGLTIGLNRLFMNYWETRNLSYMFRLFNFKDANGTGTDTDEDQKLSLYADWVLPDSHFEVYGEFGLDDFTSQKWANPFHTAIYTIGVKQLFPHSANVYGMLNLEWNDFEMSQDFQLQWPYGGYYFHNSVTQGFTNNGQIIGAGSGYSGNSQLIKYTLYYPKGKTSVTIHRNCPDINYILNLAVNSSAENKKLKKYYGKYETFLTIGLNTDYFLTSNLQLSAGIDVTNISFPNYSDINGKCDFSASVKLGIKYSFDIMKEH